MQSFVILGEKMEDQTLAIPIDKIKSDFQSFLTPEHNRRIIFSGPFGIGKTFFLNKFFKENAEYYPIFLRPVNYSLLTNEDIFKLIKYDILAELIKEEEFKINDEFDFTKAEYFKFFFNENKFLILRNLLKAIPKIRNIISAADDFEKLILKYKEGLDKINSDPSLEMLKQFQQDSENNFLLEYDEVSGYISSKIDEIAELKKAGEEKVKKVLVIDDLDRLDPEHIFRLFNIFSAHFDQVHYYENPKGNDNKFGFDKIIFVCDIENIRKIFHHKYGGSVDFSGYIDKFYSTDIYNFNNYNEVIKLVNNIFKNLENNELIKGGSHSDLLNIIKPIFSDFIIAKAINLRIVKNIKSNKYGFRDAYFLEYYKPQNIRNYQLKIVQTAVLLFDTLGGDFNNLHLAVQKAKALPVKIADTLISRHLSHFLPILNFKYNLDENSTWNSPWNNRLNYKLIQSSDGDVYYAEIESNNSEWVNNMNYYDFFELVILNLRDMRVFDKNPD